MLTKAGRSSDVPAGEGKAFPPPLTRKPAGTSLVRLDYCERGLHTWCNGHIGPEGPRCHCACHDKEEPDQ